jgi:hypothetical protein
MGQPYVRDQNFNFWSDLLEFLVLNFTEKPREEVLVTSAQATELHNTLSLSNDDDKYNHKYGGNKNNQYREEAEARLQDIHRELEEHQHQNHRTFGGGGETKRNGVVSSNKPKAEKTVSPPTPVPAPAPVPAPTAKATATATSTTPSTTTSAPVVETKPKPPMSNSATSKPPPMTTPPPLPMPPPSRADLLRNVMSSTTHSTPAIRHQQFPMKPTITPTTTPHPTSKQSHEPGTEIDPSDFGR